MKGKLNYNDKTQMKKISKKKIFKKALALTWNQFATTSTIHGIPHIAEPKANKTTKTFWVMMVLICLVSACALLTTFIKRYKSNPVRLNVQTSHAPIGGINFPAVVFCNANFLTKLQIQRMIESLDIPPDFYKSHGDDTEKSKKYVGKVTDLLSGQSAVVNASNSDSNSNKDQQKNQNQEYVASLLNLLAGFVEKTNTENLQEQLLILQDLLKMNRYHIETAMEKLMFPCSDLLFRCRWAGEIVDCKKIFAVTESSLGYCCGFNLIPATRSTSKHKVSIASKRNPYFGAEQGLSVVLRPLLEENAVSTSNSEGIRMFLNDFDYYPYEVSILKMLPLRMETLVELEIVETINSAAVQGLSISDRGCYFENEYQLRFFARYSEANCEVENRMDTSNELCDCLPYYYYKVDGIEVCDFSKIECLVKSFDKLKVLTNEVNITKVNKCLPQCDRTTLTTHITHAPMNPDMVRVKNMDKFYENLTDQDMVAHIYWKSQTYRILRRDLLTSIISLISNLGGVYSLLIGMSILSVIEVLYFSTIRLYLNYRNFKIEEMKPKTFTKRLEVFDHLRVPVGQIPRLDTAHSSASSRRATAFGHY